LVKSKTDQAKAWLGRIEAAERAYQRWDEEFQTKRLEEYYLGHQRPKGQRNRDKYTINLVFPSIETQKPSLLFFRPRVRLTPKPARADDPDTLLDVRAALLEDTAQTFIEDQRTGFVSETELALHEAFFRFGVIEVGFDADYIDNPRAGKPMLKDDDTPVLDGKGEEVMEPPVVPESERVYFRRIPASQFRVPVQARNRLDWCDWVAYYEWVHLDDVKKNKRYKNTSGLRPGGKIRNEYEETDEDAEEKRNKNRLVQLWKVWDIRQKQRYVLIAGHDKFLVEEPFDYLPFAALRFYPRLDEFYPLPPVYNWLSPQDELNETREQQRVHRRRFNRRYTVLKGSIDDDELSKLERGDDGTYAWVNNSDPISPVPDAPHDTSVVRNIPLTKEDFLEISGVSDNARGETSGGTATEASISESRLRIRESHAREQVGRWLSEIVGILLKTLRDRMSLPMWIQTNVDPQGAAAPAEAFRVAQAWQSITSDDLGDFEFDVAVDVESLSPLTEEAQRQQWGQVLALLGQPYLLMALLASETLLRKTLRLYGIRSEKELLEVRRGMLAILQPVMQQQGQGGNGAAPSPTVGPNGGASPDSIMAQMQGQVPGFPQ